MSKNSSKPTQANNNNHANQLNSNKGKSGTNKAYDAVQGNRGAQLNPNNPKSPYYKGK